ncbi:uncharacterized protein TNCV_895311 [Trichonephila clavipes]|nr:uncharacterized protein TNCV_895311 [Trichonephila clavipes]
MTFTEDQLPRGTIPKKIVLFQVLGAQTEMVYSSHRCNRWDSFYEVYQRQWWVRVFESGGVLAQSANLAGRGKPEKGDCQVIYSQFGLAIHLNDHQARRRFVEWAQNEIAVVPDFHKRILFSDEAHFWLNGYVNKQNCHIWSEANPQVYVETLLHPEKQTVRFALWAGGIIGPYFFKNDEGHNVTVNGDRYRAVFLKLWGAPPGWRDNFTRGARAYRK